MLGQTECRMCVISEGPEDGEAPAASHCHFSESPHYKPSIFPFIIEGHSGLLLPLIK